MRNIKRHCGIIESIDRMPSSYEGNPRYSVLLNCGPYTIEACTAPDSSLGYSLPNYMIGARVHINIGSHYRKNTIAHLELTK
jgi:hypothetical protein